MREVLGTSNLEDFRFRTSTGRTVPRVPRIPFSNTTDGPRGLVAEKKFEATNRRQRRGRHVS